MKITHSGKRLGLALSASLLAGSALAAEMSVYKNPWCGCCEAWVQAMRADGHQVTTHDVEDLDPVKRQAGVPGDMEACHTVAMNLDGRTYVIEGHVPRETVDKLISERPDIRGIAVPGMPDGSLGMGDDPKARYTVWAFGGKDGKSRFYEAGE
jgi:hypothetical protein